MGKQTFQLKLKDKIYSELQTGLLGEHQILNAAAALGVIASLNDRGADISEEALRRGLMETAWPGRLEIMQQEPVVIVDGAHNEAGAKTLRKALEEVFDYERLILLLGIFADKAVADVVEQLAPLADTVIVSKSTNPRAMSPEELAEIVQKKNDQVIIKQDIFSGIKEAFALAGKKDLICIAGSLSTMSEARKYWEK